MGGSARSSSGAVELPGWQAGWRLATSTVQDPFGWAWLAAGSVRARVDQPLSALGMAPTQTACAGGARCHAACMERSERLRCKGCSPTPTCPCSTQLPATPPGPDARCTRLEHQRRRLAAELALPRRLQLPPELLEATRVLQQPLQQRRGGGATVGRAAAAAPCRDVTWQGAQPRRGCSQGGRAAVQSAVTRVRRQGRAGGPVKGRGGGGPGGAGRGPHLQRLALLLHKAPRDALHVREVDAQQLPAVLALQAAKGPLRAVPACGTVWARARHTRRIGTVQWRNI